MGLLNLVLPLAMATTSRRDASRDEELGSSGPRHDSERRDADDGALDPDDEFDGDAGDDANDGLQNGGPVERTWTTGSTITMRSTVRHGPVGRAFVRIRKFLFQPGPEDSQIVPHYRHLPILSGVVVPFSTLLEIPGLTEHWYIRTEGSAVVEIRANPAILDVGMAVSMACGLLANVFLVCRFLEKRPRTMTLLAIVCLTIHDILNAIAVSVFGIVHRVDDGFTYGEAFWITLCSTVASTFVNVTLIVDFVQTKDFAKSGSGLTRKQRSLVIIIMILLCWIALGALCNTFLNNLNFVEALYFTVVSVETVGFGDISPISTGARIFNIAYTVIGILNLALAVSIARETIIEAFEQSYRRRKHELAERRREHRRRRIAQHARTHAIETQLRAAGLPIYVPRKRTALTGQNELNTQALTEHQLNVALQEAAEVTRSRLQLVQNPLSRHSTLQNVAGVVNESGPASAADQLREELALAGRSWEAQEQAYRNFRRLLAKEEKKEMAAKLTIAWSVFLIFWVLGAVIFWKTEGWSFGIALYFCFITFSTIGYGDFSPRTPAGRAIFVVWALMGVAAMTILISVISEAYSSKYHNIVTNDAVDTAVKAVRAHIGRKREDAAAAAEDLSTSSGSPTPSQAGARLSLVDVKTSIQTVSQDLIDVARDFQSHLQYFGSGAATGGQPPPDSLRVLLDDLAEAENIDEKMKATLLQDAEARKMLFALSYEKRLRKLIGKAERAIAKLGERSDDIAATDDLLERTLARRRLTELDTDDPSHHNLRTTFLHAGGFVSDPHLSPTRDV